MKHEFFNGIDFETITDALPPVKFELSSIQKTLVKYLPKNKMARQTITNKTCYSDNTASNINEH